MDKLERAQRLHKTLKQRKTPLSMLDMQEMFDHCSESTVKRTLQDMKNLGAPIYCSDGLGYSYDKQIAFELPGVWFSSEELRALLSIQQLTQNISGGFLDESIKLIQEKAEMLLGKQLASLADIQRVRVLGAGSRSKDLPMFTLVSSGVLEQRRLHITYQGRQRDKKTEREISPQRLVYYKGNWYLDAWCHQADDLRSFAMEKIKQACLLQCPCKEMTDTELDEKLSKSFGIFSGKPSAVAVLHFSKKAARWVQDEEWFPNQEACWLNENIFELRIPYHNPTELIMEICRYGADVEVIEPAELRQQVLSAFEKSIAKYT